jgi:uncharacterized repeat protein (TIGR01451 family)
VAAGLVLVPPAPQAAADLTGCGAADVGGTVFRDYDADGLRDAAEPGFGDQFRPATVTLTAYGPDNAVVGGPTTPDADGDYTFTDVGAAVRIEISGLPSYLQPGALDPAGAGSMTTVVFAEPGNCSADVGLNNPNDFCGSEGAALGVTCFDFGAHTDNAADPAFVFVDEGASGSNLNQYPIGTTVADLGATYGLAYQRTTGNWYVGAYSKRHVDYGPTGDPGSIYTITSTGASPLTSLVAGPNLHGALPASAGVTDQGPYFYDLQPGWPAAHPDGAADWDDGIFDAIGKIGVGDIELNPMDDRTLYVVNLWDRSLHTIDTTSGLPVRPAQPIPDPGCLGGADDWRPFGLGWNDGTLYVGGVCSGQTRSLQSDLSATVFAYDPVGEAFVAAPAMTIDAAGFAYNGCPQVANCGTEVSDLLVPGYYPWTTDFSEFVQQYGSATNQTIARNQPMLTDIEFDNGDLLLGFRDRGADQIGRNSGSTDPTDTNLYTVWGGAGDLWRACHDGSGGWILESGGSCGGVTPASPLGLITSANGDPANIIPAGVLMGTANNQGPGGGEYYWSDNLPWSPADYPVPSGTERHSEITYGGLVQIAGRPWVATNAFDLTTTWEGGLVFFDHADGSSARRYRVFGNTALGKAQGLGDVEAACGFAPVEIGNRVWLDTDGNGIQDPDEIPIVGATVRLYDGAGAVVGTAVTGATGQYTFIEESAPNATGTPDQAVVAGGRFVAGEPYVIRLDNPVDYDVGGPLDGLIATRADYGGAGYIGDDVATGGSTHDVHDSDGIVGDSLALGSAYPETPVVHLADTDGDGVGDTVTVGVGTAGDNDHTFDFGFVEPQRIGNLVWNDANNNGMADPGEEPIPGVVVDLRVDDGDGTFDPATDTLIDSQTTDTNGNYWFGQLDQGHYWVTIAEGQTVLDGFHSSDGRATTDPNDDVDDVDDGDPDGTAGSASRSGLVSIEPLVESTAEAGDFDETTVGAAESAANAGPTGVYDDRSSNLTVDFGFYQVAGIGNIVWLDEDRDGTQGADEPGVAGVTVELVGSSGTVQATTITDSAGLYTFTGLAPGEYRIRFDLSTLPADHLVTQADVGTDSLDSDADPVTGETSSTTLDPGEFDPTWDLGIHGRQVDLALEKSAESATVVAGGDVVWILTVSNLGLDPASGPIVVTDSLPDSLQFSSASGDGWTCTEENGTVRCERPGDLPAGASTPTLRLTTTADGPVGPLDNLATVAAGAADSNSSNDASVGSVVLESTLAATPLAFTGASTALLSALGLLSAAVGALLLITRRQRLLRRPADS